MIVRYVKITRDEKVESCDIVKSNLGVLRDLHFRENDELMIGYLAVMSQWPSVHVEYCALS